MAKIQDYNFETFYYLIDQNQLRNINCYDLGENLICSFNDNNTDDLIAKIKIFANKLKSGNYYTFKCKTNDNATKEYCYNVTKSVTYDEIDNSKSFTEKVQEHDIEKDIRRKIEFEKREEELEVRQKKIAEKEKMLNGFASQGMQIVEIIGVKLLEKYKPLFMPPQQQQEYEYEQEPLNGSNGSNDVEAGENREIDLLFTIQEQNKLVELLKNNEIYLTSIRNMLKD